MTLSIRVAGATFTDYLAKPTVPVRDGLVGEFYFGTSEGDNLRNWAIPSLPLSPVGAITYDEYSASHLDLISGFQTQHPDTPDFTLIHVGRTSALNTTALICAGWGTDPHGIVAFYGANQIAALYVLDTTGVAGSMQTGAICNAAPITTDGITVGRASGAVGTNPLRWVERQVGGVRVFNDVPGANPRVLASRAWGIGVVSGKVGDSFAVTHRAALIYNRKLSDLEVATVTAHLRSYYAARGIAV